MVALCEVARCLTHGVRMQLIQNAEIPVGVKTHAGLCISIFFQMIHIEDAVRREGEREREGRRGGAELLGCRWIDGNPTHPSTLVRADPDHAMCGVLHPRAERRRQQREQAGEQRTEAVAVRQESDKTSQNLTCNM